VGPWGGTGQCSGRWGSPKKRVDGEGGEKRWLINILRWQWNLVAGGVIAGPYSGRRESGWRGHGEVVEKGDRGRRSPETGKTVRARRQCGQLRLALVPTTGCEGRGV
jgi:hypothetical protein